LGDNVNQAWLEELRTAPVELMLQDELNHPSLLRANLRLRGRLPYKIVALVHHLRCCEPEHPPLLRFLYAQIERLYLNSVDAVLCNSHTTMAAVTDRLWRPLPTHVAAPGANHLPAPVESPAVVTADGGLRVLAVGNVSRRKQIHVVVAALCQLPAAVRWSLTIAGRTDVEPGYTAQVQAQIAAGAAAARVTWAGRLTDDELVAAYRSHDLLALPSYEGFGIVYLEAMRFGLPVIAARSGAAHEIVRHGENGFLAPPGDAAALAQILTALAADPALRRQLSAAARARYTAHPTWEASMEGAVRWVEGIGGAGTMGMIGSTDNQL
jgi:glycosyltransferase involved in cell wall biosynthesis